MRIPAIRSIGTTTVLAAVLLAAPAHAATFNAVDSGWWSSFGYHDGALKNYAVGGGVGIDNRNFFVFDLSGLSGTVTSATLRLANPAGGYHSANATETYATFDVTTPLAVLSASGSGAANIPIFTDLGTGTMLGSLVVNAATGDVVLQMTFNAAGLAYLQRSLGGRVAIGGVLTSYDADPNTVEELFGFTGPSSLRQLDVQTTVPEPATGLLLVCAWLVSARRRRARR